jgi:hypothetical protein
MAPAFPHSEVPGGDPGALSSDRGGISRLRGWPTGVRVLAAGPPPGDAREVPDTRENWRAEPASGCKASPGGSWRAQRAASVQSGARSAPHTEFLSSGRGSRRTFPAGSSKQPEATKLRGQRARRGDSMGRESLSSPSASPAPVKVRRLSAPASLQAQCLARLASARQVAHDRASCKSGHSRAASRGGPRRAHHAQRRASL